MDHTPLADLRTQLIAAQALVTVGAHYSHYKHPDRLYRVNGLSVLEASDEVAVRYALLDAPEVEFVRPLVSWLETVSFSGRSVRRFTRRD